MSHPVSMAAPSPNKLRRVLSYWAATAVLYVFCAGLVFHEISEGLIAPGLGWTSIAFAVLGLGIFYILIRTAHRLGIPNWRLAYSQAIFAIVYDLLLYVVLQHVHAAILIGLPVIIVFCAFALRPRQTVALAALGIGGLAAACAALAASGDGRYPAELEFVNFALTAFGVVSVTVVTSDLSKLRYRLNDQKRQLEDALAKIES
ncbi:MAG: diguanylate cyclase, partial [Telluria sp.]